MNKMYEFKQKCCDLAYQVEQETVKRKYQNLGRRINCEALVFILNIRYKEFLHNVYYEKYKCYCDNLSEKRIRNSEIEICRYKNRIQVTFVAATRDGLTKSQKKIINKILRTNVQYKRMENGCTEIIFNVNPHKMWLTKKASNFGGFFYYENIFKNQCSSVQLCITYLQSAKP